jgi:class 3 adenylate cyclase
MPFRKAMTRRSAPFSGGGSRRTTRRDLGGGDRRHGRDCSSVSSHCGDGRGRGFGRRRRELRSTALATKRVERKLTAILAADVAGYSRLMSVDEERTHERLMAHLRDLVDPKIKEHRGRIVKSTGDGMLAEFSSVVDAVRCAAEIQRAMIDRNADMPEDKRISFRIGINLGDVIVEREDIFGDSVNIAARLQALAEPGGICISPMVRDQIRAKLPYSFTDMGEKNLKNIPSVIRVYRVDAETQAPFVAPVTREDAQQAPATPNGTTATNNLPVPLTRVVGRDDIIATLTVQLAQRRFLTILMSPAPIARSASPKSPRPPLRARICQRICKVRSPASPTRRFLSRAFRMAPRSVKWRSIPKRARFKSSITPRLTTSGARSIR